MKTLLNIPKIFLGFLLAALLMWFLINLSKEYQTKIVFDLNYDKLPQEKIFREPPSNKIGLFVKGSGFKLLSTNLFASRVKLSLDKYKKYKSKYFLLTYEQKSEIEKQLISGLELLDIIDDTIQLNLGTFRKKKVPVIFKNTIKFKPGYAMSGYNIVPDSIFISGPEEEINAIHEITTNNLELDNILEDTEVSLNLQLPEKLENVKMSTNMVAAEILVDKYTEGSFDLPIIVLNKPDNLDLKIYPKKVTVTYKVGLKNYSKITEDSFEVVCDYSTSVEKGLNYLIPTLKKKSKLVSSARITPQKVDYLLQK